MLFFRRPAPAPVVEPSFLSSANAPYALAIAAIAAIALLVLLAKEVLRRDKMSKHKQDGVRRVPVVAGAIPVMGHAVAIGKEMEIGRADRYFDEVHREYGPAFEVNVLGTKWVLLDGTFKTAFFHSSERDLSFIQAKNALMAASLTVGTEAATLPWHKQITQRGLSRAKSAQRLPATRIEDILDASVQRAMPDLREAGDAAECADLEDLAWDMLSRMSSNAFFGASVTRALHEDEELIAVFKKLHTALFGVARAAAISFGLAWIKSWGEFYTLKRRIRRLLVPEILARQAHLAEGKGGSRNDFLWSAISEPNEKTHGRVLSARDIADKFVSFIMASMVSNSGHITHMLYDVASRGDGFAERLVAEQRAALSACGGVLSEESLEAMPYLKAFMWESLRHSGPIVAFQRQAATDVVLESSRGEKVLVPRGHTVAMSTHLAYLDESIFADARAFDPARYFVGGVADGPDAKLIDDPASIGLFPFGIGRNICPGRHFGTISVRMAVVLLMQKYRFRTTTEGAAPYFYTMAETKRVRTPVRFERVIDQVVPSVDQSWRRKAVKTLADGACEAMLAADAREESTLPLPRARPKKIVRINSKPLAAAA